MIVVNTDFISGKKLQTLSLVRGSTVHSKNLGRDILSSLKTIVGGEIVDYTNMMNEARAIATRAEAGRRRGHQCALCLLRHHAGRCGDHRLRHCGQVCGGIVNLTNHGTLHDDSSQICCKKEGSFRH